MKYEIEDIINEATYLKTLRCICYVSLFRDIRRSEIRTHAIHHLESFSATTHPKPATPKHFLTQHNKNEFQNVTFGI